MHNSTTPLRGAVVVTGRLPPDAAAVAGTAVAAFAATNVDDFLLLVFYYSRAAAGDLRVKDVVFGQFLGFTLLCAVSGLGAGLGTFVPLRHLSLIGLLPLFLGVRRLVAHLRELRCGGEEESADAAHPRCDEELDEEEGDDDDEEERQCRAETEERRDASPAPLHPRALVARTAPAPTDVPLLRSASMPAGIGSGSLGSPQYSARTVELPPRLRERMRLVGGSFARYGALSVSSVMLRGDEGDGVAVGPSPPSKLWSAPMRLRGAGLGGADSAEAKPPSPEPHPEPLTRPPLVRAASDANLSVAARCCRPVVLELAALTVVNGGDNLGVYLPLFATTTWPGIALTLAVFYALLVAWCAVAYALVRCPVVANAIERAGEWASPVLLILLGLLILRGSVAGELE